MTTTKLVSKTEFARRSGRAKSTVSEAFRAALAPAIVGHRVNLVHPSVRAWAESRGIDADALCGRSTGDTEYTVDLVELARLLGDEPPATPARGFVVSLVEPWVLELAALAMFERDERGEVADGAVPEGLLASALVGDSINTEHPSFVFFLARLLGRVPTADDVRRFQE